ncbi:acyl-CoA N-acyltransferase [Xylariomycetidae sp. FL0641]|nr:acyl-CoA N-acyltransferase [Xylariomycetidae sp. FL0641]
MSLPSSNPGTAAGTQSSIRNFFRPAAPPGTYATAPRPSRQQAVPAPPPPAPTTTTTTTTTSTTTTTPPPPPPPHPPTTTPPATTPTAPLPRPPGLPPQASISAIRPAHIPALRRITSLLLPVAYPDSFYARIGDPAASGAFSRVLLWRDDDAEADAPAQVVGGLVCRAEPSPFPSSSASGGGGAGGVGTAGVTTSISAGPKAGPRALYIQSLVLLAPYRGLGLAAALLASATEAAAAASEDSSSKDGRIEDVYAHVWTQNDAGLRWYLARGFAQLRPEVKGYYFKLRPDGAWIVRRRILAPLSSSSSATTTAAREEGKNGVAQPGSSVTAAAANLGPPRNTTTTTTTPASSTSFQTTRPPTEWNDLPADMHAAAPAPATPGGPRGSGPSLAAPGTGPSSGASSRSSSAVRRKRERAYPAAAFGR